MISKVQGVKVSDKAEYNRLDGIVGKTKDAFIECGLALAEMQERQLYKAGGFKSFDAYCQTRHKIGRHRGYQLIKAAAVAKSVDNCQHIPNEGQARELAKVPEEKRQEVWEKASEDGKPTAAKVKEVAEKVAVRTDGKISGGPSFNVDEIEAADPLKPPKNGRPTVATKDRTEALKLFGKLMRMLDVLGIGEKWAGRLSELVEDIKRV